MDDEAKLDNEFQLAVDEDADNVKPVDVDKGGKDDKLTPITYGHPVTSKQQTCEELESIRYGYIFINMEI